jgi:hypothetical protein
MSNYDSKTATVEQSKSYANCVQMLHPEPMPEGAAIILKVVFICVLIGMGVGVWKGWKEEGPVGSLFGMVLGGALPLILAVILGGVLMAIGFIFS